MFCMFSSCVSHVFAMAHEGSAKREKQISLSLSLSLSLSGVSQKGSRERCLPFFSENETEENEKKKKKE